MSSPTDDGRQVRAIEAADDPGTLMDIATGAFEEMTDLAARGDHERVRKASVVVGDLCLALCVTPATSRAAAEDKQRFLAIMTRWAWPRDPALGAVLDAAWRAEQET